VATGPLEVTRGQEALFDGGASSDPAGPKQISEYHWVFGDGQEQSSASPTISHAYSRVGSYTVSLTVTDAGGLTSAPSTLPRPVAVVEAKSVGEEITSGRQSAPASTAVGGTSGYTAAHPGPAIGPDVTLKKASLSVGAGGMVPVVLYCPVSESACAGTVTLRAVVAIVVRRGKKPKQRRRRWPADRSPSPAGSESRSCCGSRRRHARCSPRRAS
jgi:hypothetical protein